jgi:hypothetical protein
MATHSDALAVLRRVYLEGLRIDLVDGATPVVRGGTPSPELLVHLKQQRLAILDNLREHRIGERDPGYNSPLRRCYVVPDACMATKACARLGPCSESLRRLPCDHSTPQEATS